MAVFLFIGAFVVEAALSGECSTPGIGAMAGVALVGGIIIYSHEKKK